MNLVFLGPPGAGKGTQALGVCEKYSLPHISTGDILRGEIKQGTELGLKAQSYMNAGQLVPDDVVIGIVASRLSQPDCKDGFLFDGFPRTLAQAEALASKVDIEMAINIDVPDANIVERLSGRRVCKACGATFHVSNLTADVCTVCGGELIQRDDDRAETVQNRLKVYHEQTSPLIDFYAQKGVLKTVDGTQSIDDVFAAITAILDQAFGQ